MGRSIEMGARYIQAFTRGVWGPVLGVYLGFRVGFKV